MTSTITRLNEAVRSSADRRQRRRRLQNELASYSTPAERAELEAMLERHGTTVAELLRSA